MSRQIIKANPNFKREVDKSQPHLNIAECFTDTIQGEGVTSGKPATFLRLQYCTLSCVWCDSTSVWKYGNPYTIDEVLDLWEEKGVVDKLRTQHLILTGGSPVRQQNELVALIDRFIKRFGFKPFIEIENECTLMPLSHFEDYINQWNNSPKLANSGMRKRLRYKEDVLRTLSTMDNSWFKFVVDCEEDWGEILVDFLQPSLIKRNQIVLMPKGSTREELAINGPMVADLAIREGVRYSDRLQVTLWNQTVGV